MREPLAAAHVALSAIILLWDIVMAGRIAQVRTMPRPFAALAATAGLLIAPALVVQVATGSMLYGRAIQTIAWVWPATLVLFALQALYALVRRLVTPVFGLPLALYNTLIAVGAVIRFAMSRGMEPPALALHLVAAQGSALAAILGTSALYTPAALHLPILAPAFRARWRTSALMRLGLAVVAAGWTALIVAELPIAGRAIDSYSAYATERLQERAEGTFAVGLKLFPDLTDGPSPLAVRRDLEVVDSIGAGIVSIVLRPAATDRVTLDSLRRMLEERRRAGTRLMVSLGYDQRVLGRFRRPRPLDVEARLAAIERITRRLQPDILAPALEPYGRAVRVHGRLLPGTWIDYLTEAARRAQVGGRGTTIAIAASSYGASDSALYAWATSPESPVGIVGFSLLPSRFGARGLEAQMQTAERWMAATAKTKPHWVLSAGAFPTAHGERSQEQAVHGVLAWATSRPEIHGVIFVEAADYDRALGFRAPDGRLRAVTAELTRAVRALRDQAVSAMGPEQP